MAQKQVVLLARKNTFLWPAVMVAAMTLITITKADMAIEAITMANLHLSASN